MDALEPAEVPLAHVRDGITALVAATAQRYGSGNEPDVARPPSQPSALRGAGSHTHWMFPTALENADRCPHFVVEGGGHGGGLKGAV